MVDLSRFLYVLRVICERIVDCILGKSFKALAILVYDSKQLVDCVIIISDSSEVARCETVVQVITDVHRICVCDQDCPFVGSVSYAIFIFDLYDAGVLVSAGTVVSSSQYSSFKAYDRGVLLISCRAMVGFDLIAPFDGIIHKGRDLSCAFALKLLTNTYFVV